MLDLTMTIATASEVTKAVGSAKPKINIETLFSDLGGIFDALKEWSIEMRGDLMLFGFGLASSIIAAYLLYAFCMLLGRGIGRRSKFGEDVCRQLGAPLSYIVLVLGLSFSNNQVKFPGEMDAWLDRLFLVLFVFAIEWSVLRVITIMDNYFSGKNRSSSRAKKNQLVSDLLRRSAKTLVWVITIIFLLQHVFDYNISALIAGAGVAGLALAFAAQNTISNFFGAVSLAYDNVFKVGERLLIDGQGGVVESMGLRSVTLRSLDGSVWSIPNHLVADSKVENISRRKSIKHTFKLGLIYSTTPEQMQQALGILKEIFTKFQGFDSQKFPPLYHFTDFNSFSLDITVMIWFDTLDYSLSQDWKQEINMEILRRFNAAGLEFAYPTSKNYIVTQPPMHSSSSAGNKS